MSWQATKAVMEHSQAKGAARLVLCVLAYHATPAGECSPSPGMSLICQEANLSERGAQQAIRKLEEIGEIITQIGRGKGNLSSYKICLPIEGEAPAKGARIAPLQPEEKGQSVQDGPAQKGQTIPQKGQSVPEKGQNSSAKGAIRAAHIGRTVLNRHEPSEEPAESARADNLPFLAVSDDPEFLALEAMCRLTLEQYTAGGRISPDFERRVNEQIGQINAAGGTILLLQKFFSQRQKLPSLNYLAGDYQTWLANERRTVASPQVANGYKPSLLAQKNQQAADEAYELLFGEKRPQSQPCIDAEVIQ